MVFRKRLCVIFKLENKSASVEVFFFFLIFNMRSFCCCVNICFGRELQRKKYKTGRCGVVDWKYFYQFWSFFCSIWKYWPKKRMNWSKNKRNRNRKTIGWAGGVVERWKGIFFFFYRDCFSRNSYFKGVFHRFFVVVSKTFSSDGSYYKYETEEEE